MSLNIKQSTTLVLLTFLVLGCKQHPCIPNIEFQPLYGNSIKCSDQLAADDAFLAKCDASFANRKMAATQYIDWAWKYFQQNQIDSSVVFFNRAWLLDSLNANIYWGLGTIAGVEGNLDLSLKLADKSIRLEPNNANAWETGATTYTLLFYQRKELGLLNNSVDYLKKAIQLKPSNASLYGQLTNAYSFYTQKDSARKYMHIADQLDSTLISSDLRRLLN